MSLSFPYQVLTDGLCMPVCFSFTHPAINSITWGQPVSSNDGLSFSTQASIRTKGTGLGIKASSYELSPSDTYKDAARKAMFSRFTEFEWSGEGKARSWKYRICPPMILLWDRPQLKFPRKTSFCSLWFRHLFCYQKCFKLNEHVNVV